MKIKVNKHKLNIHYRGSVLVLREEASRTQQHEYCLRSAHSHHMESHLTKNRNKNCYSVSLLSFFTEAFLLCAVQANQKQPSLQTVS